MKKNSKITFIPVLFIGFLFCLPLCGGCQKDDVASSDLNCSFESVNGPEDDIAGKWKLIKVELFSSISDALEVRDYSCNDIVYWFYPDGTLIISSDIEEYTGHSTGKYFYETSIRPDSNDDFQNDLLIIDNRSYSMFISTSEATIELNPIDPLAVYESKRTAYFVRMQ